MCIIVLEYEGFICKNCDKCDVNYMAASTKKLVLSLHLFAVTNVHYSTISVCGCILQIYIIIIIASSFLYICLDKTPYNNGTKLSDSETNRYNKSNRLIGH